MVAQSTAARCTRHPILVTTIHFFIALAFLQVAFSRDNHDSQPFLGTGAGLAPKPTEIEDQEPHHFEEFCDCDAVLWAVDKLRYHTLPQHALWLLAQQNTMEQQPSQGPWECWCGRRNKAKAIHCGTWSWMVAKLHGCGHHRTMDNGTAYRTAMDMGECRGTSLATAAAFAKTQASAKATPFAQNMVEPTRRAWQLEQGHRQRASANPASATDDQGFAAAPCATSHDRAQSRGISIGRICEWPNTRTKAVGGPCHTSRTRMHYQVT